MKRDWELCRTILRLTEELPEDQNAANVFDSRELQSSSRTFTGYHVHLLQNAGLPEAMDFTTMSHPWDLYPRYLTMAGHDFLEAKRNESTWNKTMELIKSKEGGMTLEILKDVALTFLRGELGI